MWSTTIPNRRIRILIKVIAGGILVALLFTFSTSEVDYVYTGF